jgi:hypothetical protein
VQPVEASFSAALEEQAKKKRIRPTASAFFMVPPPRICCGIDITRLPDGKDLGGRGLIAIHRRREAACVYLFAQAISG